MSQVFFKLVLFGASFASLFASAIAYFLAVSY